MSTERVTKEQVLSHIRGEAMITLIRQLGYTPVQQAREWKILCPFHADKNPSLGINPHKGRNGGGIFKCFPCGWSGDIFRFVAEVRGFGSDPKESFRKTLDYIADMTGLSKSGSDHGHAAVIVPRETEDTASNAMTPMEVLAALKRFRAAAIDPAMYLNEMGLAPQALEWLDACVAPCRRNRDTGEFEPKGGPCLIVPQRSGLEGHEGELLSIRFRSLEKKKPGERTRRWSLDIIDPEDGRQLKRTNAGLMAPTWVFEQPPTPGQMTVVVEGETDLCGGLTTMVPWGSAWEEWPARWIGLPGAGSCHDMLGPTIVGTRAWTFTDRDHAGRMAVFDRPRRKCLPCGKGASGETCPKCKAPTTVDRTQPILPGLLSKWAQRKIRGFASFPPELDGTKPDLRELVKLGWDWSRLEEHLLATATANRRMTSVTRQRGLCQPDDAMRTASAAASAGVRRASTNSSQRYVWPLASVVMP